VEDQIVEEQYVRFYERFGSSFQGSWPKGVSCTS